MGKKGESGACGNATKGTAREEAGAPYKGKGTGKKAEKGGTGGSSAVTLYKCLGKISDILHLNNKNNQLER